jgi:hypothetical protein
MPQNNDPSDLAEKQTADRPTHVTDNPNLSTEHQRAGDARRPSDTLDRGQPDEEAIPRKSSLT